MFNGLARISSKDKVPVQIWIGVLRINLEEINMGVKRLFEQALNNNIVVYDSFDWSGYPTKKLFELLRHVWYSQFYYKPESYIVSSAVKNGLWCFDRDLVGSIDTVFGFDLEVDNQIGDMGIKNGSSILRVAQDGRIKENTMLITDFKDAIIGVY